MAHVAKRSDPTSCSLDTGLGGSFLGDTADHSSPSVSGVKNANWGGGGSFLGDMVDHSSASVSEVKNAWVLPPLPHASFWHGS